MSAAPSLDPPSLVDQVCEALAERRLARLTGESRGPSPRNNAIASDLGDCDRALALAVLAWQVRPPLPPGALERMEQGNEQERIVLRQLMAEGWDIAEGQSPVEIRSRDGKTLLLRGYIDGRLMWPVEGRRPLRIPIEIKDTSFPNFMRWRTVDDLRVDRWARKWWRQTQVYLLALGEPWGLILLTHRGERRPIPIPLDYDAAEKILQRLERSVEVRGALAHEPLETLDAGLTTLDVPFLGDRRGCLSCDFHRRVCFPPTPGGDGTLGDTIVLDDECASLIARERALAAAAKEHATLERRIEKLVPRGSHGHAGDWIITGHWEEQRSSKEPGGVRKIWKRAILGTAELTRPRATAATEDDGADV